MIKNIAIIIIFGKPLVLYLGILTLVSFLFTASISILNVKLRIHRIPFKWHPRMAIISIILGFIHGFLAASLFFNF